MAAKATVVRAVREDQESRTGGPPPLLAYSAEGAASAAKAGRTCGGRQPSKALAKEGGGGSKARPAGEKRATRSGRRPRLESRPAAGRLKGRKSRILVVDDHPIVRQGLVKLIEQERDLEVSGEAEDTRQALERLSRSEADLAIVDLSLKGDSGLELVKKINTRFPRLPVLVLSMHEESLFAERVLKAGGSGYIMKQEAPANLMVAIRRVLGGSIYVSDKVAEAIVRSFVRGRPSKAVSPVQLLSDRELEVFQLIGQGLGTRQVAEALYLSVKTIETYRQRIKQKLGLKTATELVHRACGWRRAALEGEGLG